MDEAIKGFSYEHFSHGADIGIRGRGSSIEEAFIASALALTAVVTNPDYVLPQESVSISLEEKNLELLFLDWINALIYEMDTKKMLFSSMNLTLKDGRLRAKIQGEKVDRKRHDPAVEIKGATLTELMVKEINHEWIAQCVVDV